jgi:hypothetical protein
MAVEARLADQHQRESMLEASRTTAMVWVERQLPAFVSASQNVAVVAALLDTFSTPSTDGVGEMYQRLKSILGTITGQQAESCLQHWVEASVSPPVRPNYGGRGQHKELWRRERRPHQQGFEPATG